MRKAVAGVRPLPPRTLSEAEFGRFDTAPQTIMKNRLPSPDAWSNGELVAHARKAPE
jgi:hypothetical protein